MKVTHQWTDDTATIRVECLPTTTRLLHVTDAHVALIDERDAEFLAQHRASYEKFASWRRDAQGHGIPSEVSFSEAIERAHGQSIDLLALTGDIVQFPAAASVGYVAEELAPLTCEVLYTAGNHDWWFSSLSGREEVRQRWRPVLEPLHRGHPSHHAADLNGLRFVTVDNSIYQIDEAQLAFVSRQLDDCLPTVLLMHIPLSLPTLRSATIAQWQAPILIGDPDWDGASRTRWRVDPEDAPATREFSRLVSSAPNLVAIFCGHVHFPHVDSLGPMAAQYVGRPGFLGGTRYVEFAPL